MCPFLRFDVLLDAKIFSRKYFWTSFYSILFYSIQEFIGLEEPI